MKGFFIILGAVILLALMAWRQQREEISYVAVGDSYTAGTGVDPKDSWPAQLTRDLNQHGVKVKLVGNLAKTGKATKEVIAEQLPEFERLSPGFATLLVGVNDFNRGYSREEFRNNLGVILDRMLAKLPKNRLVVVTIPDFSVTPMGAIFGNPAGNSAGVAAFNEIIAAEAAKRNLPVVDIYGLSQQMAGDQSLVSSDQLHPSAKEYLLWEEKIYPVVYSLFNR